MSYQICRVGLRKYRIYSENKIYDRENKELQRALTKVAIKTLETPGKPLDSANLFCCLDFLMKQYPQLSYEGLATMNNTALLEESPKFERFLAIPCLIEGWWIDHITLFFLEKTTDGCYHLEFFDSKGYSILRNPHAKNLHARLKQFFTFASIKANINAPQKDRYNCGVYICWYLENRLTGKRYEEMPTPDIEAYRLKLAKRMSDALNSAQ